MRILPNLLILAWAALILGSLLLAAGAPPGADPAQRAALRVGQFLVWQSIAAAVAVAAAGLSFRRRDRPGTRLWWMGWAPLGGTLAIGLFVALAVLAMRLL